MSQKQNLTREQYNLLRVCGGEGLKIDYVLHFRQITVTSLVDAECLMVTTGKVDRLQRTAYGKELFEQYARGAVHEVTEATLNNEARSEKFIKRIQLDRKPDTAVGTRIAL